MAGPIKPDFVPVKPITRKRAQAEMKRIYDLIEKLERDLMVAGKVKCGAGGGWFGPGSDAYTAAVRLSELALDAAANVVEMEAA